LSRRNIKQIQKNFITYNIKSKGNIPYNILLIEVSLSSNSSQNHQRIKRGWHKYTNSWLNQWGIWEDVILQNTDSMKNIITSKLKENIWCDKELEDKRKLRYYKEVVNPNLEDQKYLFVLTNIKKRINIAKIRTNSHELHSETWHWTIPKTPWHERI